MNKKKNILLLAQLLLLAVLCLTACVAPSPSGSGYQSSNDSGGGSGTGNTGGGGSGSDIGGGGSGTGNGGGGSGTGIVGVASITQGTITRAGELQVNGYGFDTSGAQVTINGVAAEQSDLRVGMIATVVGKTDVATSMAEATSIDVSTDLIGTVDEIDLAGRHMTIAGQGVVFNDLTVFDGLRAQDLAIGLAVAVSGLINTDDQLIAGYIGKTPPSAPGQELTVVSGKVQELDSARSKFKIGTQLVDYSAAQFVDLVASGLLNNVQVQVTGQIGQSGVLLANRIRGYVSASSGEVGELVSVEGVAEISITGGRFKLGAFDILTVSTTAFVNGTAKDVAPNVRLIATGYLNGSGQIQADRVEFYVPSGVSITGVVQSVDAELGLVKVGDLTVKVDSHTRLFDASSLHLLAFALANIAVGDRVTVIGTESNATVTAKLIRREALSGEGGISGPNISVRGFASVPTGDPFFNIGTLTVDTTAMLASDSFTDAFSTPITRQDFFSILQGRAMVEAEGSSVTTALQANKARLLALGNMTIMDITGHPLVGANDLLVEWDGTLNNEQDVIDGTTLVNMHITNHQPVLDVVWTAHDIRVFGPGTYSFNTCTNNTLPVSCRTIQMVVGPDQIGAHILMDWNLDRNVDVINVWDRDRVFCADVPSSPCAIYPITADGGLVNALAQVKWRLVSTDQDRDGIEGILVRDGYFAGSISINFNFN